jgi:zona occludens toxin
MGAATLPITLLTATPGGGKTALAVQILQEAAAKGRPIFQLGIPELKLPYIPTPPVKEWTEMRIDPDDPDENELPYFTFPENALIVLDEAQRIFRVRAASSAVPAHVQAFETVRHTGVTFLLMTQNPTFLDSHIRKLVGKHIHLRDAGLLGRWYYEWPECGNVDNFATAPIKKKWALPKESFGLYKSASLHIKRKYSVPPVLAVFLACVLIAIVCAWYVSKRIGSVTNPEAKAPAVEAVKGVPAPPPVAFGEPKASGPVDGATYLASFVPVAPGRPESAPAYDGLRQVRNMPRVVGGACNKRGCKCYNQQGRDAGLDDKQCKDWLAKPPFDPYQDEASHNDGDVTTRSGATGGTASAVGLNEDAAARRG